MPHHSALYLAGAASVIIALVALLVSPYALKPGYYTHEGEACSPSYCYYANEHNGEVTGGGSSSPLSCGPGRWSNIPCVWGVKNECGNFEGQSPIDLGSSGSDGDDGQDDECAQSENDEQQQQQDDASISSGGVRLIDRGTCTFADLSSALAVHHHAKTAYPPSSSADGGGCSKPTVYLDHFGSDNTDWELIQFHFHVGGSEHTLHGTRYSGEVHLVHQSVKESSNELLVLGIMLDASSNNEDDGEQAADNDDGNFDIGYYLEPVIAAYEAVADKMAEVCQEGYTSAASRPRHATERQVESISHSELDFSNVNGVDYTALLEDGGEWIPYHLLPGLQWLDYSANYDDAAEEADWERGDNAGGAFEYMGSLTTPPCSSGVLWYVADVPLVISSDQMSRLVDVVTGKAASCNNYTTVVTEGNLGTYRPTQRLAGRRVDHRCNF